MKRSATGPGLVIVLALPLVAWGCGRNGPPGDGTHGKGSTRTESGSGPGFAGQGPPRPGQIMPPVLRESLGLTVEQKQQLEDLQKEADRKLGQILTQEQKKQFEEMEQNFGGGPGGFGRRGPGGPREEETP